MSAKTRAFSLIEVLVLLAIIAILSAMIVSGISMHKNAGLIAKTRIQFLRYESALKSYCREYGGMPPFLGSEELTWLNAEGNSELFIKALSGQNLDGSQLSQKDRGFLNPLGKQFFNFSDDDFFKNKDGSKDKTKIADAFNNTNIGIIIEGHMDDDVVIHKSHFPEIVQKKISGDVLNTQIAIFSLSNDYKTSVVNWIDK